MSRQPRPQGASTQPAATRQNEYFVPRDGIDREVISADICRYLGNDALVRPGHYEVWLLSCLILDALPKTCRTWGETRVTNDFSCRTLKPARSLKDTTLPRTET